MKHQITIIFALCSMLLCAQNSQLQLATEQYAAQNYEAAIDIYTQLLQSEGVAPELYYNLANAYYKNNQIGEAVLNYERALALRPNYEDAKFNLEFVNQQITDKIEKIQPFFLSEWISALARSLTSNQWAIFSIIAFVVCLILVFCYVFSRSRWLRKTGFFGAIFAIVISLCTMAFSFSEKNRIESHSEAIVMVGSTTIKSAPDESGTELFVLHEGTKVVIKSTLADWVEIRIADGHVGWVKKTEIERI